VSRVPQKTNSAAYAICEIFVRRCYDGSSSDEIPIRRKPFRSSTPTREYRWVSICEIYACSQYPCHHPSLPPDDHLSLLKVSSFDRVLLCSRNAHRYSPLVSRSNVFPTPIIIDDFLIETILLCIRHTSVGVCCLNALACLCVCMRVPRMWVCDDSYLLQYEPILMLQ